MTSQEDSLPEWTRNKNFFKNYQDTTEAEIAGNRQENKGNNV